MLNDTNYCECRSGMIQLEESGLCASIQHCRLSKCNNQGDCTSLPRRTLWDACICDEGFRGENCELRDSSGRSGGALNDRKALQGVQRNLPINMRAIIEVSFGILGSTLDPEEKGNKDAGRIVAYDPAFDLAGDALAQKAMNNMCRRLETDKERVSTYKGKPYMFCFYTEFQAWAHEQGLEQYWNGSNTTAVEPDTKRQAFIGALRRFKSNRKFSKYSLDIGLLKDVDLKDPPTSDEGDSELKALKTEGQGYALRWVRVRIYSNVDKTAAGITLEPAYKDWERWMGDQNSIAPPSFQGKQSCQQWVEMKMQLDAVGGIVNAIVLSVGSAFISILFFTASVTLALLSGLTIMAIVCISLGLLVNQGFTIGAIEALSLTILVGLSIDYCLHLGHAFVSAGYHDRQKAVRHALRELGVSILYGAATTIICSMMLVQCELVVFVTFGRILLYNTVISCFVTLFFFMPLLAVFGPRTRPHLSAGQLVLAPCPFHGDFRYMRLHPHRLRNEKLDPLHCARIALQLTIAIEFGSEPQGMEPQDGAKPQEQNAEAAESFKLHTVTTIMRGTDVIDLRQLYEEQILCGVVAGKRQKRFKLHDFAWITAGEAECLDAVSQNQSNRGPGQTPETTAASKERAKSKGFFHSLQVEANRPDNFGASCCDPLAWDLLVTNGSSTTPWPADIWHVLQTMKLSTYDVPSQRGQRLPGSAYQKLTPGRVIGPSNNAQSAYDILFDHGEAGYNISAKLIQLNQFRSNNLNPLEKQQTKRELPCCQSTHRDTPLRVDSISSEDLEYSAPMSEGEHQVAVPGSEVLDVPIVVAMGHFLGHVVAPSVTAPSVTAPPVTAPPVTAPPVPAPPVTAPSVPAPPVAAPPASTLSIDTQPPVEASGGIHTSAVPIDHAQRKEGKAGEEILSNDAIAADGALHTDNITTLATPTTVSVDI